MSAYTDALDRLANFYNSGVYDVVDNPGGFDRNGYRQNFFDALADVATVGAGMAGPAGGEFTGIHIEPATDTYNQAIVADQTGPITAATGPFSYNLFTITHRAATTGSGFDAFGNHNAVSVGVRVNMLTGGVNLAGQVAAGAFIIGDTLGNATSPGDRIGLVGSVYSTSTDPVTTNTLGIYGVVGYTAVAPGGFKNWNVGIESDVAISTTGSARKRVAFHAVSSTSPDGTGTFATELDTAFAITRLSATSGFKKGISLTGADSGTAVGLRTDADFFYSDTAATIANFVNLSNITVSGNYINFPQWTVAGLTGDQVIGDAAGIANTRYVKIRNALANAAAFASFQVENNIGVVGNIGAGSSTYAALPLAANKLVMQANATSDGIAIFTSGADPVIIGNGDIETAKFESSIVTLTFTDPNTVGPALRLMHDSATPAASDTVGSIFFTGRDSGAALQNYASVLGILIDPTAVSEDGAIHMQTTVAGSLATRFRLYEGLQIGLAPTGGDKGPGTINAAGLIYVNNVEVASTVSPTFTTLVTINNNAAVPKAPVSLTRVFQINSADGVQSGMLFDSYRNGGANNQPFVTIRNARGSGAAFTATGSGDLLGFFGMVGATAANTFASETGAEGGVFFGAAATEAWSGTNQGTKLILYTTPTGTAAISATMTLNAGVIIGAPTGGDKGVGSLNVAADIYKNNAPYTSPDYVFEQEFTGKIIKFADAARARNYRGRLPMEGLRQYVNDNFRLPGIDDTPVGIFERGDIALEKIEEAYLYIFDLENRIKTLEKAA